MAAVLWACPTAVYAKPAWVLKVHDGDTVTVLAGTRRVKLRLFGIDAPEYAQAYGPEAAAFMRQKLLHQTVDYAVQDRDRYGRAVAKVKVQGKDVGEAILHAGLAWHYRKYSTEHSWVTAGLYEHAQLQARRARRGLWQQHNPQAPWDYRAARRATRAKTRE